MEAVINSKLKFLPLLAILACGETEQIGSKLSQSERDWLRLRAAAKCVSDTNADYADLIASSNENMLEFERDDHEWKFEYKKASAVIDTHKIFIWKTTATAVYFRIEVNAITTSNVFLKYTTTENNDLFRSLQEDDCAQTYTSVSPSASGATLTDNDENFSVQDATTQYKNNRTYTFSESQPGFFGHLRLSQTKQLYNNDDVATTSEKFDFEITGGTNLYPDQPALFTDAAIPNKIYCVIDSPNPVAPATYRKTGFPINVLNPTAAGSNLECNTTAAAIDINTDGTIEFNPATEL